MQNKNSRYSNSKYYRSALVAMGLVASVAIAVPAFAQTTGTTGATTGGAPSTAHAGWTGGPGGRGMGMSGGMMGRMPGVFGTVSAIDGTTLTVTSKTWQRPAGAPTGTNSAGGANATAPTTPPTTTTTTYTVDASSATVTKNGASSSVSSIAVGDTVMVQGTVSGTSVTATKINDGVVPGMKGGMGMGAPGQAGQPGQKPANPASIIQGNGEPVVGGSVTAISGTTLTVTNKSNVTYTVDASSATITKGNATSSIASVATGDNVLVQGTVNGTSITASSVIDQGATPSATTSGANGGKAPAPRGGGFFGAIGSFFSHLFGF